MRTLKRAVSVLVVVVFSSGVVVHGENLGTGFTYQGELELNGVLVADDCDFEFSLWDAASGGNQVGPTLPFDGQGGNPPPISVDGGRLTVELDFGADVISGEGRWLEIKVCCPSPCAGAQSTLVPRQELTPVPHALVLPGLRTEQNLTSPNLIGGHRGNHTIGDVVGATISGGGSYMAANRVTDDYGTVAGGRNNEAGNSSGDTTDATYPSVGGGLGNTASDTFATVAGGVYNVASGESSSVGGGENNTAGGRRSTVCGGHANDASASNTTIGGGTDNTASGVVATVGGGGGNAAGGEYSAISGGFGNLATGRYSTVCGGGGGSNVAAGNWAVVGGGDANTSLGHFSTVAGGYANEASGTRSAIPGGQGNVAGGAYSFAVGYRAKTNNAGCFTWADSNDLDFPSPTEGNFTPAANQFLARTTGGAVFVTGINGAGDSTAGVVLSSGSGSWSSMSDRNAKDDIERVSGREVLRHLNEIVISKWRYKSQDASIRHIGPMAQDFFAAFGIGEDEKFITSIDADGVALAAIQGLSEIVQEKEEEIVLLKARIAAVERAVAVIAQQNEPKGGVR